MPSDPTVRFERAWQLGRPALLSLRADVLLQHADGGKLPLTQEQREELERICAAPKLGDADFLGGFDCYFEAMDEED